MKCEESGHIQADCANTWSDDESEACNEGEDICHESVALISPSTAKQCSDDLTLFSSGPPIDPLTYESPASMTKLGPLDVVTTDVESSDDEEISNKEMAYSYKIMYEKLVEIVNENRGLLKHISQLYREKNKLIKQVNMLKNEKEESLNELEQIKKTIRMINSSTTTLDQIMLMGKTTKDHEGLGFKE